MILLVIILSWFIFSILACAIFCKIWLYNNDLTCSDFIFNIILSILGPVSFLAAIFIWIGARHEPILNKVILKKKGK